jgi:methylated-DNA-[protein]-cysteine S-methyltransferase
MMRHHTMSTPTGPLTVVVSNAGAVRAAGFTAEVDDLLPLIHPALREEALREEALREETEPADDISPVATAVRAYFDGDLTAIDEIEVEQRANGEFMSHAWHVMRDIKPGEPLTYTEFAALAGRPAAVRAAAAACAQNPVAFFTPCHRVLRLDGSLGGYRWGLEVKRWLLDHEAAA